MTIRQILHQYLEEQKARLAPRTFEHYEGAVKHLEHCFDRYGHLYLDEEQRKRLHEALPRGGEFCDLFGAEALRWNLFSRYAGYFLPRKVICGYDSAQQLCRAALNCYQWLCRRGYLKDEDASETAKDLREEFREAWKEFNKEDS